MMGAAYTVQAGDTLVGIARAAGMDWRDLLALNQGIVKNPNPYSVDGRFNIINPGMVLRLVAGGAILPPSGGGVVDYSSIIDASNTASNSVRSSSSGMMWLALAAILAIGAVIISD